MKLDSKFFDRLRVKPDAEPPAARLLSALRAAGLQGAGPLPGAQGPRAGRPVSPLLPRPCARIQQDLQLFRRPARRGRSSKHQKDDTIGHRPTWSIGVNSWARDRKPAQRRAAGRLRPPLHHLRSVQPVRRARRHDRRPGRRSGPLKRAERKCLRQLNLEDTATKADIKARFKELVKRLHPDHNKGDRTLRGQVARSDPSL